jgi:hypothetical protein
VLSEEIVDGDNERKEEKSASFAFCSVLKD